jgi:eukaryotic-like serine/threonine-protein kinase
VSTAPSTPGLVGRDLGPYHVLELIGKGGMGEVYRAADGRLHRQVALKVLPRSFAAVPERLQRFEREARAASAIQHPNIAVLYEVDSADGIPFIAMEYVPGMALSAWVARDGVSLVDILRVMEQLADALAKAHGAGVLHRDLKPANVFVTPDGQAKLLDFGLAKVIEERPGSSDSDVRHQITTRPGTVFGTLAYMSPEQARGQHVDRRSDIFSFGVLLYEAVSGTPPFAGESGIEAVSGVLRDDPVPRLLEQPGLPRELVRLLAKCLEKDPDQRYQYMDDVRVDLRALRDAMEAGGPDATGEVRRWLFLAAGLALGLLVGALAAPRAARLMAPPDPPPVIRAGLQLRPITFGGLNRSPSLSPDGELVSYASDRHGTFDILVQQASAGRPLRVTDDPGDEIDPAFSPDGQTLAFATGDGRVRIVPTLGGTPRTLASGGAATPVWSPQGERVAFRQGRAVYAVDRQGGVPVRLTSPESPPALGRPAWSPDGRFLVFASLRDGRRAMARVASEGGLAEFIGDERRALGSPVWSADGNWLIGGTVGRRELFGHEVWAVPVARSGRLEGEPVRILAGVMSHLRPSLSRDQRRLAFEVSGLQTVMGRLPLSFSSRLTEPARILTEARVFEAEVSHTGDTLALATDRAGPQALWRMPVEGGPMELLRESTAQGDAHPTWSPDDRRLALVHVTPEGSRIAVMPAAGGPLTFISGPEPAAAHPAWSPNGRRVAYLAVTGGRWALKIVPSEGGPAESILDLGEAPGRITWSPDGRNVAAAVQAEDGGWNVLVVSAQGGPSRTVLRNARAPLWLAEGRLVFVREGHPGTFDLWSVPVDAQGTPAAGAEAPLTRLPRGQSVERTRGASTDGRSLFFPLLLSTTDDVWLGEAE